MAVGLPEVAQGVAGTGLAWMGPNSSFDPVQFAADAFNARAKADMEKKKGEADLWKNINIKPEDQYNNDLTQWTNNTVPALQTYVAGLVRNNNGWNFDIQTQAQNLSTEAGLMQKRLNNQYTEGSSFKKIIDSDKGKELNYDTMNTNYNIWQSPESFVGTAPFQKYEGAYNDILNQINQNPYYKNNPTLAQAKARVEFRDQFRDDLLQTYLKPESLTKYIKDNDDVLFNKVTQEKGNGSVITKIENVTRDKRKVTFSDGSTQMVDGTDITATNAYNGDTDLKRSVDAYYQQLPETDKQKYEKSTNPALDWWKDYVNSSSGDAITSSKVESSGRNNYNFGGYNAASNYQVTPYEQEQLTTRTGTTGGNTTTRGFNIRTPKGGTELVLKDVNPPYFYQSNSSTQTALTGGKNMTFEGVSPFKAPTLTIDINTLKSKLGDKGWGDFVQKFGDKYQGATAPKGDIILTDAEVKFLQSEGMGQYIQDKKYARGTLSYYMPSGDSEKGDVLKHFNGAIVPLDYVAGALEAETNLDFSRALDQFQDNNYNVFTKSTEEVETKPSNSNTTVTTKSIKDEFTEE